MNVLISFGEISILAVENGEGQRKLIFDESGNCSGPSLKIVSLEFPLNLLSGISSSVYNNDNECLLIFDFQAKLWNQLLHIR